MTSKAFDDDVDFETEEETSEFEDEEESISTVTVKLPPTTTSASVSSKSTPVVETPTISITNKIPECAVNDEIPLKKSTRIKNSKESVEKITENGHDLKSEKNLKPETRMEMDRDVNQVQSKADKFSSKSKVDFDSTDESSKKHKSERRKSKEEKKKDLPVMDAADDVEVSSRKSSKSKKEKNYEPDESSSCGRKRNKSLGEEGRSSKSKKDKHDKTGADEVSSLQFVGEVSEAKEKIKSKKKKSSDQDGKNLEQPSPSPSSSSSDLEKLRADKTHENKTEGDKTDEEVKVVKVIKIKSKKSSAPRPASDDQALESAEVTKSVDEPVVKEEAKITPTPPVEGIIDRNEEVKRVEKEEKQGAEVEADEVSSEDADSKNKLSVTTGKMERDHTSPDHLATGRIEQTRNYLKALTPEDCCRSAGDDEKSSQSAVFEVARREELEDEVKHDDIDGEEPVWESNSEPIEKQGRIVVNEDSDFTYRRKSMDEFIKKILAEAREENQKLKEDTEKARKPPTSPCKPRLSPDEDLSERKSRKFEPSHGDDDEVGGDDDSKELDDINKYFSKRREESDTREEKPAPRQAREPAVAENGHARKDHPKTPGDDDVVLKPKKGHLSTYVNYEDDDVPPGKKQKPHVNSSSLKKPPRYALMNGDVPFGKDGEEEEVPDITDFLSKFKRDRQALFGGGRFEPEVKRSAETEEMIKEKTRNIKSVIDQQMDICHNVRVVSKQLDDLEKELREVRQISLDRRNRMEAMENSVNAEYKMYEIEHQAALDRVNNKKPLQKFTQEVKDQMIASIQQQQAARSKKGDRYRGDLNSDDVSSSLRRRVGSVSSQAGLMDEQDNFFLNSTSNSPYHSFASSKGRGTSSDRDPYLSSFLTVDRRRDSSGGGSRSRLSFIDNGGDFDDLTGQSVAQSNLFSKPKSRASVATMDTSASISADDFLSKMRSKYSFLNPGQTGDDVSSRFHSTPRNSGTSGYRSLTAVTGGHDQYRGRLEEPSPSTLHFSVRSIGGRGPSPGSLHDLPGSRYSLASSAGGRYSGLSGLSHASTLSSYEPPKSRRASSVADIRSSVHYDKHLGGYTTGGYSGYGGSTAGSSKYSLGGPSRYSDLSSHHYAPSHSSSASSGGEFKSRFLDKVREKRSSVGSSSSSHDLADRVKARLKSSKSSYDPPASSGKQLESAAPASTDKPTAEAK